MLVLVILLIGLCLSYIIQHKQYAVVAFVLVCVCSILQLIITTITMINLSVSSSPIIISSTLLLYLLFPPPAPSTSLLLSSLAPSCFLVYFVLLLISNNLHIAGVVVGGDVIFLMDGDHWGFGGPIPIKGAYWNDACIFFTLRKRPCTTTAICLFFKFRPNTPIIFGLEAANRPSE